MSLKISGINTEIETDAGSFSVRDFPFTKRTKTSIRYYGRRDSPDIVIAVEKKGKALEIRVTLDNNTENAQTIKKISIFKLLEDGKGLLGSLEPDIWLFRQGMYSPGDHKMFVPLFHNNSHINADWFRMAGGYREIYSYSFTALKNLRTGKALLAGFVTLADQTARINVHTGQGQFTLEPSVYLNDYVLSPGKQLLAEVLRLEEGSDGRLLTEAYADSVKARMKPKYDKSIPVGWSSWQYYRRDVTEQDILDNLTALKDGNYPVEYILLDDGFQLNNCEWWKTNKKFPHGLKWLSNKIRSYGYLPGLWIAPLTVLPNTPIYKQHKDWLVKDKEGRPLKKWSHMGYVYVVDYTVKAAQKYLAKMIRILVKEQGFRYLKLDGPIMRYYVNGVFSKRNATPVQVIRTALKVIRDNSKGALIEGEGYYGPSIGLVDVQRTAQDIQTDWFSLKNNLQGNLMSNAFHKRWWINNPDAFIIRDTPTPHHYEEGKKERALTAEELKTEITAHMLSGGEVMLTDNMPILDECRKVLVDIFIPPEGNAAEALDMFNGEECPNIFRLKSEGCLLVAAFNWTEKPRKYKVSLKLLGVKKAGKEFFDLWDWLEFKQTGNSLSLNVSPHGVKFIMIGSKDRSKGR